MAKKKRDADLNEKKERYQIICHNCGNKWDADILDGCACGNKHVLVNDHSKLTSRYLNV